MGNTDQLLPLGFKRSNENPPMNIDKYMQTLLSSYKSVYDIQQQHTASMKTAYNQFNDFDEEKYKRQLITSYKSVYDIQQQHTASMKTAYNQFNDFDEEKYKRQLITSYKSLYDVQQQHTASMKTAYNQFNDFDEEKYKKHMLELFKSINNKTLEQHKNIQFALNLLQNGEENTNISTTTSKIVKLGSLLKGKDVDSLVKSIIQTPTKNNMNNVNKLLKMLSNDPKSKISGLVIVATLLFLEQEKQNAHIDKLIQKINNILGPTIKIPGVSQKAEIDELFSTIEHENIRKLYVVNN
jgi:hypothetical protein